MAELRPKIVKLAKMVGGIAGVMNKIEEESPEYMALECVVSDEQADVALTMGLRKPRTVEYVSKKCNKSIEETHKILMELAVIGVCKVWHEDGVELFWVNIFAPGMLEMMVNNREQLEAHPQIGKAFELYTRTRLAPMTPMLPEGMAMMRVIPIESALGKNFLHTLTNMILSQYLTVHVEHHVVILMRGVATLKQRCVFRWAQVLSTILRQEELEK